MGANSIRSFTVGFALTGISIIYFIPSYRDSFLSVLNSVGFNKEVISDYISKFSDSKEQSDTNDKTTTTNNNNQGKFLLLTKKELANYDGGPDSQGLYLAILGEVFDVAKGAQHYKPGSSYNIFAGKDATRSYITGVLDEDIEPDNLEGLDEASYASLSDWLSFYKDEYPYIGKVIGRYYDKNGNPSAELQLIQSKMEESETNKWLEQNEKEVFPPCNSEWSKEKGNRVWCTEKSGGVDRDWVGVPRKFYKTGKDPRCVCVRDSGPPSDDLNAEKHNNRGDLEHPNLQEYPDCPITAPSCKVNHP